MPISRKLKQHVLGKCQIYNNSLCVHTNLDHNRVTGRLAMQKQQQKYTIYSRIDIIYIVIIFHIALAMSRLLYVRAKEW